MQGSFKATFSGAKSDISLLTAFVEETYPELMAIVEYPDDFDELADDSEAEIFFDGDGYINDFTSEIYEEMCKAAPALSMDAYISWDCDGNPMNKYISAAGSAEVTEIEGTRCAGCGTFIDFGDLECYNEFDEPVCAECAEGAFEDFD